MSLVEAEGDSSQRMRVSESQVAGQQHADQWPVHQHLVVHPMLFELLLIVLLIHSARPVLHVCQSALLAVH